MQLDGAKLILTKADIWFQHNSYHWPNNSVLTVAHDPVPWSKAPGSPMADSLNMKWSADTCLSLLAHLLCHNVWPLEGEICAIWGAPEGRCWRVYWFFIDHDDSHSSYSTSWPSAWRRRPFPSWNTPDGLRMDSGWTWVGLPLEAHLTFTLAAIAFCCDCWYDTSCFSQCGFRLTIIFPIWQ